MQLEVAAEVEHAREVERQMARDAREKMRAEKTEPWEAGVAKKSEELKKNGLPTWGKTAKENKGLPAGVSTLSCFP